MPRFYFHLHNSVELHDDEGRDLPSLAAARTVATEAARALMAEDLKMLGEITLSHHITVEGEYGVRGFVLPFRACVEIRP